MDIINKKRKAKPHLLSLTPLHFLNFSGDLSEVQLIFLCIPVARFTGPRQACFAASDATPAKFNPIRSQYSCILQQPSFICCKTDLNVWVVKHATLLFDTFCAMQHIAKQVALCFGPFYPSLTHTSSLDSLNEKVNSSFDKRLCLLQLCFQ